MFLFYNDEIKFMVENLRSNKFQEKIIIGKKILVKNHETLLFKFTKRVVSNRRDTIKASWIKTPRDSQIGGAQ